MQHSLGKIFGKPSDYKICKKCGAINWYENEKCICDCKEFDESKKAFDKWIEEEYAFWESEGCNEDQADYIEIDI